MLQDFGFETFDHCVDESYDMLKDDNLIESFLKMCDDRGIVGIKGHRSVGGFRASVYNTMSVESIEHLIKVMRDFEISHNII